MKSSLLLRILPLISCGFCCALSAAAPGGEEKAAPAKPAEEDKGLFIPTVMGKGFAQLFSAEVLLKQEFERGKTGEDHSKPHWVATAPDGSHWISVIGETAALQKKIETWAQDHPGKPVRVAACELIETGGGLTLPIGGGEEIDGVPIEAESGQSRGWGVWTKLVIVGFEKAAGEVKVIQPAEPENPKDLRVESVMGKGFSKVFTQEVLLEKDHVHPRSGKDMKDEWHARIPGSSRDLFVFGGSEELQKQIEAWGQDHPGEPVKVAAYEIVRTSNGLPNEVPQEIDGIPIHLPPSGQTRVGWSAWTELVILGFAKQDSPKQRQ